MSFEELKKNNNKKKTRSKVLRNSVNQYADIAAYSPSFAGSVGLRNQQKLSMTTTDVMP